VNQTATKIVKAPKISFRKVAGLEYECYHNALDLHFDSILLAKARSFASAFAISVIASEEFGKGFGFAELSFQAGFSKRFNENDERFFVALLSDHKLKQGWFVSELFGVGAPKSILKRYRTMQVDKNNALYVGVRKGNHQIVRPFLISASKAKEQIRTVNEGLIGFVEARLRDNDFDTETYDLVFRRRRLLNRLKLAAKSLR
jgi:AbiV family abortive infection protein